MSSWDGWMPESGEMVFRSPFDAPIPVRVYDLDTAKAMEAALRAVTDDSTCMVTALNMCDAALARLEESQ